MAANRPDVDDLLMFIVHTILCSTRGAVRPAGLASRVVSGVSVVRSPRSLAVAPLWRAVRNVVASAVSLSGRPSFDGPYNPRLHLTAPREHCLTSVRGKPPGSARDDRRSGIDAFEYTLGAGAHSMRSVFNAVYRSLSGRAAPQVSRRPCR